MKSKSIQMVTEDLLNKDLFGTKYSINSKGVNISTFTPIFISNESHQSTHLSRPSLNEKLFRVSLLEPFFLPLQFDLSGLYEECLFLLPEMLKNDESANIIWLFQKRKEWQYPAIEMYESYLEGNDNPSDIPIVRTVQSKLYSLFEKVSPQLTRREYSQDVEDKILDDGYSFQCMIEIQSDRMDVMSNIIQEIFMQYDYHNGLRLEEIDYQYPYTFYPTNQILSKKEIMSLLSQSNAEIEISDNPIEDKIKKEINQSAKWQDRIKLLPQIPKQTVIQDETIIPRLADSLKRVGLINQARLYNESIEYGSRLTIIHADIPKSKNFSDIAKKQKDIQVALGVPSLSIEQGDEAGTIKFSIPHNQTQIVSLREIIERDDFQKYSSEHELAFIVGLDEIGNPIYLSLKELRHIMIVGSQGSGKSVFVNQLITTLLITHTPEQINFILIDPKQVELAQYEPFPHVREVVTNMQKAVKSFNGLIREMDNRYKLFEENNVKDIWGYNSKMDKPKEYIVCVIEEWADLFATAGKDAEEVVLRLGQKARAAGIFLVIVTQRPSAKILSGDIKANIQSKFSFNLGNNDNYRTVFGSGIDYQLLGKGDGVFSVEGYPKEFQRFQSPIITTNQVEGSVFYGELAETYLSNTQTEVVENEDEETTEIDSLLFKLKTEIATTGETKVTVLRDKLKIKAETLTALLNRLVQEGWMRKHKSKSKGYELIADESVLEEWRS